MTGRDDHEQAPGRRVHPEADLTPLHELALIGEGPLLERISALIDQTRSYVAVQANTALTMRNWYIGRMIHVEMLGERRAAYGSQIVATLSHQLSWSHFKVLLRVESPAARAFYVEQAISARLSVRALDDFIGRQGFERKEIANAQALGGSAVPADSFRDPYLLEFLGLHDSWAERDLEEAIIRDMETFLLWPS